MRSSAVAVAKTALIALAFLRLEGPAEASVRQLGALRLSVSSERIPCHPTPVIGGLPVTLCQTRYVVETENAGKEAVNVELFCGSNYKPYQLERRLAVSAGQTLRQAVVHSDFPDDPKRIANERSSCYIRTDFGRAKIY